MLIVEDDQTIARMVLRVIAREHLAVDIVADGAEALARISSRAYAYSAIVLDLMMPNFTGLQVLEVLRQSSPELLQRTILMTASPTMLKGLETADLGGVLVKPFDVIDLVLLLHRIIDGK